MRPQPAGLRRRERGLPAVAAVIASLLLGGCASAPGPRPSPTEAATQTPPPPSAASVAPTRSPTPPGPTPSPAPVDFTGLPALLVARTSDTATTLWLTARGDPTARAVLPVPRGDWRADAASRDGTIVFKSPSDALAILEARLSGGTLVAGPPRRLPPAVLGHQTDSGFVACRSTAGDLMVADAADELHLVRANGTIGPILPAATLGSCAWSGTSAVVFDVEGSHHLGRWQVGQGRVAMTDLELTGPSAAGPIVAAVSDDLLPGRVMVLRLPGGPTSGQLQPEILATLRPADGESYRGAALAGDAAWLVAWAGPMGDAAAWLDVFRPGPTGEFDRIGRVPFGPDEDVRAVLAGD